MDRRAYLRAAGAAAAALAGCATAGDGALAFRNGGFEDGLDGWAVGRDLPTDPNTGDPVASRIAVTDATASEGSRALSLFLDGRQDDGTVWVQRPAPLGDVSTLSVDVHSPAESFNTITKAAVYAGPHPERPLTESRFDTSRPVEDHEGWRTYDYDVAHDGPGLVAVGVSVVWETEVTRHLDDVSLR
ncbi:MAG: hypothetical protein ABEJ70_09135 [Halobacteriaceae archaeon]